MLDKNSFATCLNCMDGRVQESVIAWIKKHTGVSYVDMITEAGMDGLIANSGLTDSLRKKIQVSTDLHGSTSLFIVGHDDCGGHPVDKNTHLSDLGKSLELLKTSYPQLDINGLWVDGSWAVSKI